MVVFRDCVSVGKEWVDAGQIVQSRSQIRGI
jgi:hypothetical protein